MGTTKHDNAESRRARAEAVAWMARLQAPDRSRELEAGLREWLAQSPANAAEFERATDLWEELGGVSAAAVLKHRPGAAPATKTGGRRLMLAGAAACVAALVAGIGLRLAFVEDDADISTRIGEQRTVTLSDGSRMALNTDSRVVVEPWNGTREVRLERGEAYFEVAKDPLKPFVVRAGAKKIVALGTAFLVRLEPAGREQKVSVTLLEGRVAVSDASEPKVVQPVAPKAALLQPGERLVALPFEPAMVVDRPRLEAVVAWRRGEVVLDGTPLADAVSELNRYSPVRLEIADDRLATLPVSGIFRTGDSESFAVAVSSLYDLTISKEGNSITLAGTSRAH